VVALQLGGVAATRENVINGSYGLSRPFLFMTLGEPAGQARQFIDFTLSAEGQRLLMAEGLIPSAEGTGK
jgi:phosphate transport system substrate-binding protein